MCCVFLGQTLNSHKVSFHSGLHTCDSKLAGKRQKKLGGGGGKLGCDVVWGGVRRAYMQSFYPGGVAMLQVASCLGNRDKHALCGTQCFRV